MNHTKRGTMVLSEVVILQVLGEGAPGHNAQSLVDALRCPMKLQETMKGLKGVGTKFKVLNWGVNIGGKGYLSNVSTAMANERERRVELGWALGRSRRQFWGV